MSLRESDLQETASLDALLAPPSADRDPARPHTLPLSHARACDPLVAGNKAAHLARASVARLPTMPGFVITSWGTEAISEAGAIDLMNTTDRSLLQAAWEVLSHDGSRSVVVRSSSSGEDMEGSSVAGRFRSILGVDSWSSFKEAVHDVLASADHIDLERDLERGLMAVLVQPELKPALGGVMFGLDPVTGREDRLIASAVRGGPERLVAGEVDGAHYTLSRGGRLISGPERGTDRPLRSRHRRRLAKLAFEAQCIFGRPQNVEWAFDDQGKLWLFQSGPITATPSLP